MSQGRNDLPLKTICVSPVERPSETSTILMNMLRRCMVRGPNLLCATGSSARHPSTTSRRRRITWKTASGSALRVTVPALVWNGSKRYFLLFSYTCGTQLILTPRLPHISNLMSVGMLNLRALPSISLLEWISLSAACLKSAFGITWNEEQFHSFSTPSWPIEHGQNGCENLDRLGISSSSCHHQTKIDLARWSA